jgi:hypothetical protein
MKLIRKSAGQPPTSRIPQQVPGTGRKEWHRSLSTVLIQHYQVVPG